MELRDRELMTERHIPIRFV